MGLDSGMDDFVKFKEEAMTEFLMNSHFIVGKDGVKLLGLPSAAPIWWLGRCLDPDENS